MTGPAQLTKVPASHIQYQQPPVVIDGASLETPAVDHASCRIKAFDYGVVSVALTRRMLWRMLGADHPMDAHRVDSRGILARGASADAREGVTSFLEKRPAVYPDRVTDGLPDVFPGWVDPTFS